jgi:large subunit ribosomal protein L7/L12
MSLTNDQIVEALNDMPIIKLVELTKTLEEKWGVKAAPQVVQQGPGPAPVPTVIAEQTEFNVILVAVGEKKIDAIKAVRTVLGLGLAEAKTFVESGLPKVVKEGVTKEDAAFIKGEFEKAGAQVEVK